MGWRVTLTIQGRYDDSITVEVDQAGSCRSQRSTYVTRGWQTRRLSTAQLTALSQQLQAVDWSPDKPVADEDGYLYDLRWQHDDAERRIVAAGPPSGQALSDCCALLRSLA